MNLGEAPVRRPSWCARLACAAALIALTGTAPGRTGDPAGVVFSAPGHRYHSLVEIEALFDAWRATDPSRVASLDLGRSAGGRAVPAIQFGAGGGPPLEERPTVLLLGGLDGVSFAGGESVLAVAHHLLSDLDRLRPDLAFVAVPWAAPDGLTRAFRGSGFDGGNDTPTDEDRDGRAGEDAADDLDGDGFLLEMLIEDPDGDWRLADDPRFLVPAGEGYAPRYRRVPEGRDDDRDGSFNEDGNGGVRIDRNFPIGWGGPGRSEGAGPLPLVAPVARRLADLALERRSVCVFVFQGNHGELARPGGTAAVPWEHAADADVFDRLAGCFASNTGRRQSAARTLAEVSGAERGGSAVDWCYGVPGSIAIEVAPWGPEVVGPGAIEGGDDTPSTSTAPLRRGPNATARDRAWARWLDDERGGIGFVDWHLVELGPGERVLVGGWEPRTYHNPPESLLGAATAGLGAFTREVVDALPRLEIRIVEVKREGELIRVRARVANTGALPTGLSTTGRGNTAGGECEVELVLPTDCRLVAGDAVHSLGVLGGGAVSAELDWLVCAPEGAALELVGRSAWTGDARREIRP